MSESGVDARVSVTTMTTVTSTTMIMRARAVAPCKYPPMPGAPDRTQVRPDRDRV